MSLELLLATMCIASSNSNACTSSARAYYDYSGIGPNVRKVEESYKRQYKDFAFALALANIVAEKRVVAPLFKNSAVTLRPIENQNGAFILYEYNY